MWFNNTESLRKISNTPPRAFLLKPHIVCVQIILSRLFLKKCYKLRNTVNWNNDNAKYPQNSLPLLEKEKCISTLCINCSGEHDIHQQRAISKQRRYSKSKLKIKVKLLSHRWSRNNTQNTNKPTTTIKLTDTTINTLSTRGSFTTNDLNEKTLPCPWDLRLSA